MKPHNMKKKIPFSPYFIRIKSSELKYLWCFWLRQGLFLVLMAKMFPLENGLGS